MIIAGLYLLVAQAAASPAPAPSAPTHGCRDADHRQFDFWVGEWDVYNPKGARAGSSVIARAHQGCVIEEHWTGAQGNVGTSLNGIKPGGGWHQTWMDNDGLVLQLDGGLQGTAMVLSGSLPRTGGGTSLQRVTWTPQDGGRVRQHWESSNDEGKTWTTAFDGLYVPKGQPAPGAR